MTKITTLRPTKPLLLLAALFLIAFAVRAWAWADEDAVLGEEVTIVLSDSGVTVDGVTASTNADSAVYVGADLIYYEDGQDSSYGQGTAADTHSAAEAAAQTVVAISQPGTYRVSGTLSAGQILVDLGEGAEDDPQAVVNLILDGVDITCEIAPAILFYRVYECGDYDAANASGVVDTSDAGANLIMADGSVNYVTGSYVARIYQEGTTKKLHKYDGAISSKVSLNIGAESAGTGELHVTAEYEGIESWLHVTVNGGNLWVTSQEDGINAGEDNISVITINDGYVYVNAGLDVEGDGLDSNGYLTINGGTIITLANGRSGDGGIDADLDITLNGGTVVALGSRNDAVSAHSAQAYLEISYAGTQAAGTLIRIEDSEGNEILTFEPPKLYQSFAFTSPDLEYGTTYYVYAGGTVTGATATDGLYSAGATVAGAVQQQYTSATSTLQGGPGGGGARPEMDGEAPQGGRGNEGPGSTLPEGMEPGARPEGADGQRGGFGGGMMGSQAVSGEGSVEFPLTEQTRSFSGVSEALEASGKTRVTFQLNDGAGIGSVSSGEQPTLTSVTALVEGGAVEIAADQIQLTVTDVPSADFAMTCLLSDGLEALAGILPEDDGQYQLTVTVLGGNASYAGTSQFQFRIGGQQ